MEKEYGVMFPCKQEFLSCDDAPHAEQVAKCLAYKGAFVVVREWEDGEIKNQYNIEDAIHFMSFEDLARFMEVR